MKKYKLDTTISEFNSVFNNNGFSLYIVGGAVRDFLLGKENHDCDFCTDALPEQVIQMFNHVIPTGIKHGTVTVLFKGQKFEVTTFRTEGKYSDNRHPDNVSFVSDLNEDLSRRDFTVNAFAADCRDGKIIDLFKGKRDLRKKIIRAIGDPYKRFSEDALRLMRMSRFCSKLGFSGEKETLKAAKELSHTIVNVSKERICDELFKILNSDKPSIGLRMLEDSGILQYILPEVSICRTISQDKIGASDVLEHIFNCVDAAAFNNYDLSVRFAALLHDIGKPVCMKTEGNAIKFYGHDVKGAEIAVSCAKRLKCSNEMIDKINILISEHMVRYSSSWTDGAVKRFINRVGLQNIEDLFKLQWCDQIASEGVSKKAQYKEFIQRIEKALNEPISLKDLAIGGQELSEIGIQKGPVMGKILNALLEEVIDNPNLNTKETLLYRAKELSKTL